jgi:phage anti-repressor protein
MDVILEGEAEAVTDADRLAGLVDVYRTKYDDWFQFRLEDGRFVAPGAIGSVLVYDVQPRKVFGFAKGDTFSQTRWRF